MTCLNDPEIQRVVDGEAGADALAHVKACSRCAGRLGEFERRAADLDAALAQPSGMPPAAEARIRAAIAGRGARGATHLRDQPVARPFWHLAGWSTAAVAAAAILAFVFVIPAVRGPEPLSAAGILAESANRLSQLPPSGVELREYELALEGMPHELLGEPGGTLRIRQLMDHGTRGRFRFASFTSDGRLLSSIAQDPATRTRVSLMRIDDQYYRFEFTMPPTDMPSLPELERLHMEATIKMMQASGQHLLQEVESGAGRQYVIEVPQVSAAGDRAVWDLTHARVLVAADDFRVTEFQASGTFLQRPYSVSYKLLSREYAATVDPEAFRVPPQPGEIVIAGEGTANPAADALKGALLELARVKSR